MNIEYYNHGDITILLDAVFTILGIIVIFFLLFMLLDEIMYLLTKYEDNTTIIAFILSLTITGFIAYSSIKNVNKNLHIVIYYENPTQKVEIQKSDIIDDMCLKIKTGQLRTCNPLSVPLNLYHKCFHALW